MPLRLSAPGRTDRRGAAGAVSGVIVDRIPPLMRVVRGSTGTDSELAAQGDVNQKQTRTAHGFLAQLLAVTGALRPGLDAERARDTAFVLGHAETYPQFTDVCGLDPGRVGGTHRRHARRRHARNLIARNRNLIARKLASIPASIPASMFRVTPPLTGRRAHHLVRTRNDLPRQVEPGVRAVVIGGGIAGTSAALLLAERGVAVTLVERSPQLGGRLAAWPRTMADGSRQMVEHGFHGFFRQYYNWHNVLRRIDPSLSFLRPAGRYPVVSRQWPEENFSGLPKRPPLNLLALVARSPSLRLRELRGVDGRAAVPLLNFSADETYREYDQVSAKDFLDALGMPPRARASLFDVFAHSFFNHQEDMSAAEMIMQFHFYFLRNPEGLDFDAPAQDYETAIWSPLAEQLRALGGDIRTGTAVEQVEPGWKITLRGGDTLLADHVVLAADPASARDLAAASPALTRLAPVLAAQMGSLRTAPPYAVSRLWTDADVAPGRSVFTSVSQEPTLDSVTLYHRAERATGQWARQRGGAVIEMHAYAAPDGVDAAELTHRMWTELGGLWPETRTMSILDVDERVGRDAPAFGLGSDATRPGVETDADGLYLAGDWVRMPFPAALMERAAASAVLAVNAVLRHHGAGPEPVLSVAPRGLLAPRGHPHGRTVTPNPRS